MVDGLQCVDILIGALYFEITHQASARRSSHFETWAWS